MTTLDETAALLRFISRAMDRPIPHDETVEVWAELLAPVPLMWAKAGAAEVLARSAFWPKPGEVITEAKRLYHEEQARDERRMQLALGTANPPAAPAPAPAQGPALIRAMLAEVAAQNKGVTDRAQRRATAHAVAIEFRDRLGSAAQRPGTPCNNATCRCTHTDGCDAGWMDMDRGDGEVQAYPCGQCNPRRHTVLTRSGGNREAAMRALRDTSDVKAAQGEAW